jgi:hypothetical protein
MPSIPSHKAREMTTANHGTEGLRKEALNQRRDGAAPDRANPHSPSAASPWLNIPLAYFPTDDDAVEPA